MTQAEISSISPFFIVSDAPSALSFYRDRLGFEITFQEPADEPFFGIVTRVGAMIMLTCNRLTMELVTTSFTQLLREVLKLDAYMIVIKSVALCGKELPGSSM
jgi:glyoxalase/bleomycin resistance protein/dioxygenase superfamily protein